MNEKELENLWGQVKHIGKVDHVSEDGMVALGSVFGKMSSEIKNKKTINQLCQEAYETAQSKGWHDVEKPNAVWLALIHSEVSEALEADRKGDEENFAEELADICIRTFDLCGLRGIDLQQAILDKMEYNKSRPIKHGNKRY